MLPVIPFCSNKSSFCKSSVDFIFYGFHMFAKIVEVYLSADIAGVEQWPLSLGFYLFYVFLPLGQIIFALIEVSDSAMS